MDSFAKDVLSIIILTSWALPAGYISVSLIVSRLAALVRYIVGKVGGHRVDDLAGPMFAANMLAPVARRNPVRTVGIPASAPASARPRMASRWKSSQRLNAGAC